MSLQKAEKKTPEKTLKMGSFPGAYLCIICTVLIFKTISGERGTNNPNIIEYHTIPKPLHFQRVAGHSPR